MKVEEISVKREGQAKRLLAYMEGIKKLNKDKEQKESNR